MKDSDRAKENTGCLFIITGALIFIIVFQSGLSWLETLFLGVLNPKYVIILPALLLTIGVLLVISANKGNQHDPEYWLNVHNYGWNKKKYSPNKVWKKYQQTISKETDIRKLHSFCERSYGEYKDCAYKRKYELIELAASNPADKDNLTNAIFCIISDIKKDPSKTDSLNRFRDLDKELTEKLIRERVQDTITSLNYTADKSGQAYYILQLTQNYPEIIRDNWSGIQKGLHEDRSPHEDTQTGFHSDRTEYYDYFRYPDGRTVANKSGRKRHTDTRLSYSDCHDDAHTDSTQHNDESNDELLAVFKPYLNE